MGGQVGLVHVTVLGDRLAACLAGVLLGGGACAWGWGCSRVVRPHPFVFLGWGACARDRAEGGRERVWLVACGLRPPGRPGGA